MLLFENFSCLVFHFIWFWIDFIFCLILLIVTTSNFIKNICFPKWKKKLNFKIYSVKYSSYDFFFLSKIGHNFFSKWKCSNFQNPFDQFLFIVTLSGMSVSFVFKFSMNFHLSERCERKEKWKKYSQF